MEGRDATGRLLAVQDLDVALEQVRARRASLPERATVTELRGRRVEIVARCAGRQSEVDALAARQAKLEQELRACDDRDRMLGERLRTVMVPREAEAIQSEQRSLALRRSSLEDDVLAGMEQLEALEAAQAEDDELLGELDRRLAEAESVLRAEEATLDGELAGLAQRREVAAAVVPDELRDRYERMRARLGGVAVARLEGGRCSGCHLMLPSGELDRIRHLPPEAPVECDQCGRMLVR